MAKSSTIRRKKLRPNPINGPEQVRPEAYRQMLLAVVFATFIVIGSISIALQTAGFVVNTATSGETNTARVFVYVLAAGALGALFSALIRLYNFENLPKALVDSGPVLQKFYLVIYALIPPVIGMIAASAIHMLFASGLIKGGLFPEFICQLAKTDSKDSCVNFQHFLYNYGPDGAVNYAKLLVWGFLAGFSERLVPDMLRRVAQSASSKLIPK